MTRRNKAVTRIIADIKTAQACKDHRLYKIRNSKTILYT